VSRRGEGHERIEKEILGEKAAALGRAGERLEAVLAEARTAAARLLATPAGDEHDHLAAEYTTIRKRVIDARLALLIQREALGLRRHATVDQQFPEPPKATELLQRQRLF